MSDLRVPFNQVELRSQGVGAPQVADFDSVVDDLTNATLCGYLDDLVADEQLVQCAANRSYRHQLGFLKLVLGQDLMGRSLRLHIWDTPALGVEDIHSHCASFRSRVIHGEMTEKLFSLRAGNDYTCLDYRFDEGNGCSDAIQKGRVSVDLCSTRYLSAGQIYSRAFSDLHRIFGVSLGAATISVWGKRSYNAIVLKGGGSDLKDCEAMAGMRVDEFLHAVAGVRGGLQ